MKDGTVIGENENEYSTEKIVVIGDRAYHTHENGGARGAWDRTCGDGVWRDRPAEKTRVLDPDEARELLLAWGYSARKIDDLIEALQ